MEHSGEVANYTSWGTGEPNDNEIEPCVALDPRYALKWADVRCTLSVYHSMRVVCEHG